MEEATLLAKTIAQLVVSNATIPFMGKFNRREEEESSIISSSKKPNTTFSRSFYNFVHHIEKENHDERFEVHTTPYYRTLLRLNHLLLNDPFSYFCVFMLGVLCTVLSVVLMIFVVFQWWNLPIILVLGIKLMMTALSTSLTIFSFRLIKLLLEKFPSPVAFLFEWIGARSNFGYLTSVSTPFSSQLAQIHYYAVETLHVVRNKGIQLEKKILDINTTENGQTSNIFRVVMELLKHHNTKTQNDTNVTTEDISEACKTDEKRYKQQFIPCEDIQMIVIREGIVDKKSSGGTSLVNAQDQGGVIGSGNVGSNSAANAVADPISVLVKLEIPKPSVRKTQDLSIIMKSLHSREIMPFETTRPRVAHLKLMYRQVKGIIF